MFLGVFLWGNLHRVFWEENYPSKSLGKIRLLDESNPELGFPLYLNKL